MKKGKFINKLYVIIGIFLIIQIISIFNITNVSNAISENETIRLAATEGDEFFSDINDKVKSWETMGDNKLTDIGIDTSTLLSPVLSIAQILSFVGFCVVVIYILIHAVIRRKGNAKDSGDSKKQDVGLVITAVVLLGAYGIWEILLRALDSIATV